MGDMTGGAEPVAFAASDDPELLAPAIGRNADWYLRRWRTMDAKESAASWNWAACLLNLFWFAWRKMWGWAAATLAIMILLGAIGAAIPGLGQGPFLASIAVTFVTGTFGNHLYRRHVRTRIAATEGLEHGERVAQLRDRGGTSTAALVVSLILVVALGVVIVMGVMAEQARMQEASAAGGSQADTAPD